MCIFLYNFCFSLHYKCQIGQFLVLIGNTEELGAWDVSKGIELQWIEGNIWRKYISLKQKNDVILQYKYLVCRRVKGKIEAVRWEEGPNRYLNLKQLKKLFVSIDDVWDHRKISIFLKDEASVLSSAYIIGKTQQLGNYTSAQEMQKISFTCPIENILQIYWFKQILIPATENTSKFSFNYLTKSSESKTWEILGNETSMNINFAGEDEAKGQISPENSKLAKEYKTSSSGKIKQRKSMKASFESPSYSRLERNEFQIFQDVALLEDNRKIFKINEFLHAGSLNDETLNTATTQNIKSILVFTNLKNVKFGEEDLECINMNNYNLNHVNVQILNMNETKEVLLKELAYAMEKCLKSNENTLICWGNSKKKTFMLLIEYFCCYKKFSVDAAKKFLKISSSKELIKRKNSRQTLLSR